MASGEPLCSSASLDVIFWPWHQQFHVSVIAFGDGWLQARIWKDLYVNIPLHFQLMGSDDDAVQVTRQYITPQDAGVPGRIQLHQSSIKGGTLDENLHTASAIINMPSHMTYMTVV